VGALAGRRICLSHPYNIAYDVRLLKSVQALQEAGAEVSIMVRRYETAGETIYHDLCEIIEVDTRTDFAPVRHSEHRIWLLKIMWNLLVFEPLRRLKTVQKQWNLVAGFAEEMIARDFDIVQFTDYVSAPEALRMKSLSSIPVVYETYEYSPTVIETVHQDSAQADYYRDTEIAAMDRVDAVIVVADEIAQAYSKKSDNPHIAVVYNVPPQDPLPPSAVSDPLRFYFQSIIRPDYGLEMLIDAFANIKGAWSLAIQGPNAYPEYRDRLEDYIEEHGMSDRISFPEPVTSLEVVEAANTHDVGVLLIPSVQAGKLHRNAKMALPNKFFVYANASLAMILGDYIAMKRLTAGFDAVAWVDELSLDEVTATIQALIDDPQRVAAMKQASYEWSQRYNYRTGLDQIKEIYRSVADR